MEIIYLGQILDSIYNASHVSSYGPKCDTPSRGKSPRVLMLDAQSTFKKGMTVFFVAFINIAHLEKRNKVIVTTSTGIVSFK